MGDFLLELIETHPDKKENYAILARCAVLYEATELRKREKKRLKKLGKTTEEQAQEAASFIDNFSTLVKKVEIIVEEAATARLNELLNTWMCEGVPLGHCTFEYLTKIRDKENVVAEGHRKNAIFYSNILAVMRPNQKVADVDGAIILSAFDTTFNQKMDFFNPTKDIREAVDLMENVQ